MKIQKTSIKYSIHANCFSWVVPGAVFRWSFIKKHKVIWVVLKVYNCGISIPNNNSKISNLPNSKFLFPFIWFHLRGENSNKLKSLLNVRDLIVECNLQILILETKILLDKINDWCINLSKLFAFELKGPFSLGCKFG